MPDRIRRLVAALATAALVVSLAHPAFAAERIGEVGDEASTVPMVFDILVMRPVGLATVVLGSLFYVVPVAPIMAVTRPSDIGKPIAPLIGGPARFTFRDPIGHHPSQF